MNYSDANLNELLAAEYVLGTLSGPARWRFEAELDRRDDLAHLVEDWKLRLNILAEDAPGIPPPPGAWEKIYSRITPLPSEQDDRGLLDGVAFWRRLAMSLSLLLALTAGVLLWPEPQTAALLQTGYVVVLRDNLQRAVWVINTPNTLGEMSVQSAAAMDVPQNKRCYLWLQPNGNREPINLGVLPERGGNTLTIPESIRALLPGRLMVSFEDVGEPPQTPTEPLQISSEWMQPLRHTTTL